MAVHENLGARGAIHGAPVRRNMESSDSNEVVLEIRVICCGTCGDLWSINCVVDAQATVHQIIQEAI
jgi:hypothetical protein